MTSRSRHAKVRGFLISPHLADKIRRHLTHPMPELMRYESHLSADLCHRVWLVPRSSSCEPCVHSTSKHATVDPLENSQKQEQAHDMGIGSKSACANSILNYDWTMIPNAMISLANKCSHPKGCGQQRIHNSASPCASRRICEDSFA